MKQNLKMRLTIPIIVVLLLAMDSCITLTPGMGKKQSRITPDLTEQLSKLSDNDFIRIIIKMDKQMDSERRRQLMAEQKDKESRRKALTTELKSFAAGEQVTVMSKLKKLEANGDIKKLRALWIANVITCEAKKSVIEKKLAYLNNVAYLKQDVPRPTLQAPAWNVAHINADQVWTTTGLEGNGVVVGILDTGCDTAHPDLRNQLWINAGEDINHDGLFTVADNNNIDDDGNGYIDDVIGWDFQNDDNVPLDWHGHGTHVAGTVAGDGTGGTATGVAPGARLMILAYSASLTNGQAEAWEGMQYALDNGADIVSFSSGWKDAWSPDYQTWRSSSEVLIDGGVLFVVAAGNDGPHVAAPGDVLTPGRVPRVLTAGSVDNTDVIAASSGQGPVCWETVTGYEDYIYPPGLLKPDVSAPGVDVNSCRNGGGYTLMSGTSMATPHVSGLAALLLEEDPALLPHELAYIIRETAVDLGTAGEDNVYGYGRIDAMAAVNYNYQHTPVYDMSITGTNNVWTSSDIWVDNNDDGTPDIPVALTDNHLYARIRNIGGQAVGNVEIKFYYADVGTIGISGFDPNNDGNPDDGNFNYIDSYIVPVIGPSGSSQDEAVAVVNWNVPIPTTDHWCVGVGIVAHNPPNPTETNRTNNVAFKNFFDIIVVFGQNYVMDFVVYPDFRHPDAPFDLQFIRKNLPPEFKVDFIVEKQIAKRWFMAQNGFELYDHDPFKDKNMKFDEENALLRGEKVYAYSRLLEKEGLLKNIQAPKGEPVRVKLVLQAPTREKARKLDNIGRERMLIINANNEKGAFGGLTLNVKLKEK
jgi:subtilisin family serine protease